MTKGDLGNATIVISSLNGFSGDISLSLRVNSTAKHSPSFSISPSTVTLYSGSSTNAVFNVSTSKNTDKTTYDVTIIAAGGGITAPLKIPVSIIS